MSATHFVPTPYSACVIRDLGPDPRIAQRLAEMGVLPGARLEVVRVAPFGGAVEVRLDQGQSLALRREELAAMHCEPLALPLAAAPLEPGRRYPVRRLTGGHRFRRRMEAKGIAPGVLLELESGTLPLRVKVLPAGGEAWIAAGEAEKIVVGVGEDG